MKFLYFCLILMVSGIIFYFLYAVVTISVMGLTALAAKAVEKHQRMTKFLAILTAPIFLFVQLFCALLWVFWVVGKTNLFVDKPEVKHTWLYWIVAFFAAPAPYQQMAWKERMMDIGAEGAPNRRKQNAATVLILFVIAVFFIFALYPPAMAAFYKWFLDWQDWLKA